MERRTWWAVSERNASKKCFCNEERKSRSSLIEELVEREDTILAKAESELKQQLKDNETADDIRKKAMESLKEPKKRNSDEVWASRKCCKSRRGEPLVDFLREKQRLTAKLDNSSYMQNNRNRKVSSKWWKLWSFSSNKWILHYWLLWESY